MSDNRNIIRSSDLSDRSYMLLNQIMHIDHLDNLITLACTLLNASLYICDLHGKIIAHSPEDDVHCSSWKKIIHSGQVHASALESISVQLPVCNAMRHSKCSDEYCTRMSFPLTDGVNNHTSVICFFFWNREINYEEQCLASILAGAFSYILQRSSSSNISLHDKQIRVFRELLNYKAGLKNYYLHSMSQAELKNTRAAFRLLYISLNTTCSNSLLTLEIAHRLPDAWCFSHGSSLLTIFNEKKSSVQSVSQSLTPYLSQQQMTACISVPFFDLLRLRVVFEDCRSILPIAMKKEPETRIHMAEHYLSFAFLARCQQYFPLRDHYPEGLIRLMEYDQENNRSYLATLSAYLENNMNANAAAKSIFMHRNTLMQQMEKIEQIMGVSLSDKETCLYLQLCLRMHELVNM